MNKVNEARNMLSAYQHEADQLTATVRDALKEMWLMDHTTFLWFVREIICGDPANVVKLTQSEPSEVVNQ